MCEIYLYRERASENVCDCLFSGSRRRRLPSRSRACWRFLGSTPQPIVFRFPDANKNEKIYIYNKKKQVLRPAPCPFMQVFLFRNNSSREIPKKKKKKKPIDRADCTGCFQQTKEDMAKIATTTETTGTIYSYGGGGKGVRSRV